MKILTLPHTILNQKARKVRIIDKKIIQIIADMKKTLRAQTHPPGVGLAAPQVGIPLRIFIMKPTKKSPISVFVNPTPIDSHTGNDRKKNNDQEFGMHEVMQQTPQKKSTPITPFAGDAVYPVCGVRGIKSGSNKLEGCLSLPRIWGSVTRQEQICIAYLTLESEKKEECFTGFESIIIQHELDHLEGIIFTQRVVEQNQTLYEEKNGDLVKLTLD